ncbi:restriction endonuclease subunit S [Lactobacillus taiwanensis]|uniref:restriction endonuclease subunit S n=1 Tax=Lactobacillus taiwanensis TaxID=508451 RepID=UPI00242ECB4F|nr:restriction endonuclease subunit S [Lactobacillus taiwanensis]
MSKSYIKLGELASYINGYAFKPKDRGSEGLPIIRIQDLTGSSNDKGFYKGTYPSKIEINNGDVLISWSASLGVYVWNNGKALLNQHIFKVVFDKGEIDKDYFVYAVQFSLHRMRQLTHGATMKHVVKKDFENVLIPYPSLKDQRKVAHVLDKLKESINKKMDELKKLDELIKARFVEMFGDPVLNSQHYNLVKLSNLGTLARGKSKHRPRNDPQLLGGPYPLIQTGEITNSDTFIKKFTNTYSELGLQQSKLWPKGTLCITIAANIAQTAILTFDACFPDSVVGFIPENSDITPLYLHYWFSFFQKIIDSQASQVAQKNINLKVLSNLQVMLPPKNKQSEFASFVQQVDKSKFENIVYLNKTLSSKILSQLGDAIRD